MTKDRMPEMIQLMRENRISLEPSEPIPVEMSQSMTSFLTKVEGCRNEIRTLRDEIEQLKTYHNQIQKCTIEITRKDLEYKVEEKKTQITSSILSIRNNLKSAQESFLNQKTSPILQRMKEVQMDSVIRTVNDLTQDYYNCLVDHSEKSKKLLYDMISISSEDKSDFEDLLEKGKIAFFTNNLLLNELEQRAHFRNIEDRHADILNVEKSIVELKNLTQDLSLAVALQKEKIDSVDQYVQKTAKKVEDSARIMKKASKLKNKARKRKLIIAALCFSIVIIIICILLWI